MQSTVQWDRFTQSTSSFRFGKGEWERAPPEKPLGAREEWLTGFLLLYSELCQVNATQKHCPCHTQGSDAADAWRWTWSWSYEMKCIRKCFPFPSSLTFLLWKEDFSFPHFFFLIKNKFIIISSATLLYPFKSTCNHLLVMTAFKLLRTGTFFFFLMWIIFKVFIEFAPI